MHSSACTTRSGFLFKLSVFLTLSLNLLVFTTSAGSCRAQGYHLKASWDMGIMGSGTFIQGGNQYLIFRDKSNIPPAAGGEIKVGPDNWVQYRWNKQAARLSDVLAATQCLWPLIATVNQGTQQEVFTTGLVMSESLLWTLNLTQAVKLMKLRSRPLVYANGTPDDLRNNMDSRYSFPSGHSAAAFSIATSLTLAMKQMNIPAERRTIFSAAAFVTAGSIATLRVVAGKHYPTDVLAGMLLGCGMAYLNHRLHAGF